MVWEVACVVCEAIESNRDRGQALGVGRGVALCCVCPSGPAPCGETEKIQIQDKSS